MILHLMISLTNMIQTQICCFTLDLQKMGLIHNIRYSKILFTIMIIFITLFNRMI